MWTNQTAFDHVWHEIVVKRGPFIPNHYIDAVGGRCMIGYLLPPEVLAEIRSRELDTIGVGGLCRALDSAAQVLGKVELAFLAELQNINDAIANSPFPNDEAELHLETLADSYNLTVPYCLEVPDYPRREVLRVDESVSR